MCYPSAVNGYLYSNGVPTWAASCFIPGWGQFCQGRIAASGQRLVGWLACLLAVWLLHPICWIAVGLMHISAVMDAWSFHNRALLELARKAG